MLYKLNGVNTKTNGCLSNRDQWHGRRSLHCFAGATHSSFAVTLRTSHSSFWSQPRCFLSFQRRPTMMSKQTTVWQVHKCPCVENVLLMELSHLRCGYLNASLTRCLLSTPQRPPAAGMPTLFYHQSLDQDEEIKLTGTKMSMCCERLADGAISFTLHRSTAATSRFAHNKVLFTSFFLSFPPWLPEQTNRFVTMHADRASVSLCSDRHCQELNTSLTTCLRTIFARRHRLTCFIPNCSISTPRWTNR